jgi:signal transduction histidine kinase
VISFITFAIVGTVGLVIVLDAAFQRLSQSEFVALARDNAEFVRTTRLPPSDRLASYLSQMLGAEVHFSRVPAPDDRHEAVTVSIEPGVDLTLIRNRPSLGAVLVRPVTAGALAAFWALGFGLAISVVRPYLKAQRLVLLGQMATSLAHEIKNPVAAIRLHGQLLEKSQTDSASVIVDEASRIEGLVNQWMFLARPDPPRKTAVNVATLLEQTVSLLTPTAEHSQVRIQLEATRDWCIQADAQRLGQVFQNIILNALPAMATGGTLTITARDGTIEFADSGPGFSPAALKRWSEMWFSEKEGGMGIGLSVAREIIHAHGGQLTVANHPERGARVRIRL